MTSDAIPNGLALSAARLAVSGLGILTRRLPIGRSDGISVERDSAAQGLRHGDYRSGVALFGAGLLTSQVASRIGTTQPDVFITTLLLALAVALLLYACPYRKRRAGKQNSMKLAVLAAQSAVGRRAFGAALAVVASRT